MGSDEIGGLSNATLVDEVDAIPDHDAVAGCAFATERAACRCFFRRLVLFHFTLARRTARGESLAKPHFPKVMFRAAVANGWGELLASLRTPRFL